MDDGGSERRGGNKGRCQQIYENNNNSYGISYSQSDPQGRLTTMKGPLLARIAGVATAPFLARIAGVELQSETNTTEVEGPKELQHYNRSDPQGRLITLDQSKQVVFKK